MDGLGTVWRIRDRTTFSALRRDGHRSRRGPITVTFLPGDPTTPPRVAYAIGTRVGSAAARNRLRRRLRALVATAELEPGAYLIAAGPAASGLGHQALAAALTEALQAASRTPPTAGP